MKSEPKIAILLVNWNGIKETLRCLDSLRELTYPKVEVLIVDNGSNQPDVDLLLQLAEVQVLYNDSNLGFTGGNNVGIEWALDRGFEAILLLNNDTVVEKDFLEPLIVELASHSVGAVQPKICYLQDHQRIWHAGGIFHKMWGIASVIGKNEDATKYTAAKDVDWLTGCALMVRTEILSEVGLLDDNFFAYCEDVDYSLRLRNRGYKLRYVPDSLVYHEAGASSRQAQKGPEGRVMPFIHYLNVRNRIYLVRKHLPKSSRLFALGTQLVRACLMILYFLLRGRYQKMQSVVRGIRDGFAFKVAQR